MEGLPGSETLSLELTGEGGGKPQACPEMLHLPPRPALVRGESATTPSLDMLILTPRRGGWGEARSLP